MSPYHPVQLDDSLPTVAFQGAPGAFSEEAAYAFFGPEIRTVPVAAFQDVADRVLDGTTDYGIIPVENSLVGPVEPALKALSTAELAEVGAQVHPIELCFLTLPGAELRGIRRVLSHPVALGQCTAFQAARPEIEPQPWYDTAGAARHIAERAEPELAAIAGRGAAMRYQLEVLFPNIEDRRDNRTYFVIVERE